MVGKLIRDAIERVSEEIEASMVPPERPSRDNWSPPPPPRQQAPARLPAPPPQGVEPPARVPVPQYETHEPQPTTTTVAVAAPLDDEIQPVVADQPVIDQPPVPAPAPTPQQRAVVRSTPDRPNEPARQPRATGSTRQDPETSERTRRPTATKEVAPEPDVAEPTIGGLESNVDEARFQLRDAKRDLRLARRAERRQRRLERKSGEPRA